MIFSLEDLTTPLTRQQVEASIYEVMATVGLNTTTWKPGAVVRTMIVACSIVLSAFSKLQAEIAKSGYLELAAGPWLTLVAKYVYGEDRILATFAEGELTLTNAGGGVFALDPDDLVASSPDTGRTYRNTAAISLPALSTVTVPIRATEAGSASTASPGTITALETPLLGVSCSNASALVGRDEEPDADLRTRCNEKLGSLSPFGPSDAYSHAARNAVNEDGTPVGVTRARTVKDGAGGVTTYVATATGLVNGDAADPSTPLGAVDAAIQQLAAPLAVTAVTLSASPLAIDVTYEAWVYNTVGLTNAELEEAIATRLAQYMSVQPIGGNVIDPDPGKIFRHALVTTIGATRPEIFQIVLSVPVTDATLSLAQVPMLGAVSGTIHQVPTSEGF